MIRDILVHIPTEHPQRPVVDASVSLAASFGAHLDAIAIGYIWPATGSRPDPDAAAPSGKGPPTAQRQRSQSSKPRSATPGSPTQATDRRLRGQRGCLDRRRRGSMTLPSFCNRRLNARTIRFRGRSCYRPVGLCCLFLTFSAAPSRQSASGSAGTEAGSLPARSEMPVPSLPRRIGCLRFRSAAPTACPRRLQETSWPSIWRLPACRSGSSSFRRRAPIQPSVLSVAADENLEMLVMGAYGHSHLQEGILGGVTRAMLGTMTVPTLMSH
jgi:hypothetical protein